MWLPKFFYETLPFYYLALGAAVLGAAFYIDRGRWPEICAGTGIFLLVLGLVLVLRRKGYRASRSRLDFDRTK
jgi:drug/metabolite transporter (DMT)-like permease